MLKQYGHIYRRGGKIRKINRSITHVDIFIPLMIYLLDQENIENGSCVMLSVIINV